MITLDVAYLVHGTVSSKWHCEVVPTFKDRVYSSLYYCNPEPQSKDLSPLICQVVYQFGILSIFSSQHLDRLCLLYCSAVG